MTTPTISPEKLATFESLKLDAGSHPSFEKGHCAMEVVSWLADEGFTDAPECASPVLRRYLIALNDRWDDDKRQLLKPYLIRTIGTANDGRDETRERIAAEWATKNLVAPWLRLAGLNTEADSLEAVDTADRVAVRDALYRARRAAWDKRDANRAELRKVVADKVRERLNGKPAAVAVAVADAAAVADAVAVAVAAAAAVAVADAAAAAVAVAAAVADAAAAAVAVAVAVAVAAAVAVAVAAAVAVAVADNKAYWPSYDAAYEAARNYYKEHPLPVSQSIADLAAKQAPAALELLELLIEAKEA